MKAKEYLNQIRDCKNQINLDLRRIDELREYATSMGTKELKQDIVQTSIKNAGLEDMVGKIVDCERAVRDEIRAYLNLQEFIIAQIRGLDGGEMSVTYVELLMRRYVQFERFEVISVEMGYSYEWIRHLHGDALAIFEKQYLEN